MARREYWKAYNTTSSSTDTYILEREDDGTIFSYTWPNGTGDPTASGDLEDHRRILTTPIELGVNVSDNGSAVGRQKTLNFIGGTNVSLTLAEDAGNGEIDVTIDATDTSLSGSSAGGDLGGTYPNPTVTDLTITGEAQGDILYYDGTNWSRLAIGGFGEFLEGGTNPTWGTLVSGNISDFDEAAQDAVGTILTDTATIDVTYDDGGNQITADVIPSAINTSSLNNDAGFVDNTHTHTSGDVTDFDEAAQDAVGTILTDTSTIDFTYDDGGNQITADVLDATSTQKVDIKDDGSLVTTRSSLDFISNNGVDIVVLDDGTDAELAFSVVQSEIDTSNLNNDAGFIASGDAAGGDLSGTYPSPTVSDNTSVQQVNIEDNGTLVGTRSTLNFIQGSDISLTVSDDAANDEVDVTIAANVSHPSHNHSHPLEHYFTFNDVTQTIGAGSSGSLVFDIDEHNSSLSVFDQASSTQVELVAKGRYIIDAQSTFVISGGTGDPAYIRMRLRVDGTPVDGAVILHEWGDPLNGQSVGWYQSVTMSRIVVDAVGGEVIDIRVDELGGNADLDTIQQGNALSATFMETDETTP